MFELFLKQPTVVMKLSEEYPSTWIFGYNNRRCPCPHLPLSL